MLIGVVAHVNREHLVGKLLRDTQIDVIKWDDGLPSVKGCADNHIRVLTELYRQVGRRHRWCVVLEDDAQPVLDFREQLKMALARAHTPLVGLYLGTGNPAGPTQQAIVPAVEAAEASQSNWIVADWYISTVGYAVRSAWLPAMLTALSEMGGPVDMRINEWTHAANIKTWYTQPSLVNHGDDTSVIAGPGIPTPIRRAHRYGSRTEWSSRTTQMATAVPWGPGFAHC
jgi:hypothetical protein